MFYKDCGTFDYAYYTCSRIVSIYAGIADFGTPMLIGEGYRTFPVVLYTEFINEVGGDDGFAAAIAIIAILITTVVFLIQKYVETEKHFYEFPHPIEVKEGRDLNVILHVFSYLIIGIGILLKYMIYTSFKNVQGKIFVDGYSLNSYISMMDKLGKSIQNTIMIPAIALILILLLAILIAYLTVRRRNSVTNVIDVFSMIPYIVPGTVLVLHY